jgi:serine phosphatase RsbU (regulator of sigma subunit)
MAQAIRLFRILAAEKLMPADIANRLNAELAADNEQGMFVTMFIGLVDLTTGHLSFCNAGHNPPVFDGHFLTMEPNAPIGLWEGLDYVGEEISDIHGKYFFVYTDGLNEAENLQQEQFGDDRLLSILATETFPSAQACIEHMKRQVEQHRQGADPNDDLTLLCLKVESQ